MNPSLHKREGWGQEGKRIVPNRERGEKARCPNIKLKIDGVQSRRKLYICIYEQHQKTESNSENTLTQRSVKEVGRTGGRSRRNCDQEDQITLKSEPECDLYICWKSYSIKSSRAVMVKLTENGVRGIGGARSPRMGSGSHVAATRRL